MGRKRNEKKKANPFVPEPTDKLFYEIRSMSLVAFVHAIDGMDPNAECRVSGGTLLTWAAVRIFTGTFFYFPRPNSRLENDPSDCPHACFASVLHILARCVRSTTARTSSQNCSRVALTRASRRATKAGTRCSGPRTRLEARAIVRG